MRTWLMVTISTIVSVSTFAATTWDGWTIDAKQSKVEQYRGRDSLLLDSGEAWLDTANFEDGVIEFDVAASADAGFHGLAFRAKDHANYEHVYLRSHLSGKPDATQYTPVYRGNSGWQIYSSARFVQPAEIVPDRWVHVRAVVQGKRLELSVDGQTLVFPELLRPVASGAIGLTASISPAHFANVVIHRGETPPHEGGDGAAATAIPDRTITSWRVSTAFDEKRLGAPVPKDLQWDSLESGPAGIANLGILRSRDRERNTAIAAVTLRARDAHPVRVRFGFSDRVRVFLNGKELYRGNDAFQTRDYRFLGTVGPFDELILPLRRGDNELWFAVSEDFGGWAITAQLPDGGAEVR